MALLDTILRRPHSEERLLEGLRAGDATAAEQLYRQHVRYLTAVCSRYLACDEDVKDVLQEAFVKIFSSVGRFRYQGEGSLRAWMTRIVIHEAIDHLKANSRLALTSLPEDCAELPDEEPDTQDIPAEALHDMLRSLPDGYRLVLNLYVMEGKSHREIAALLGIKESTSASQLHKAKNALARRIKEYRQGKR